MTSLELTDQEKNLFLTWLHQREISLSEEMNLLKSVRSKIDKKPEVIQSRAASETQQFTQNTMPPTKEVDPVSWVTLVKNELRQFSNAVPSGELVKRLLEVPALQEKGKRFVTKAVTSKLWLLQERGEVVKAKQNGKFVYSLKK